MIAIITGGRDCADAARVRHVLDAAVTKLRLTTIIHGAATGADTLANEWAIDRGDISVIACPADWETGKSAEPIRNRKMLDILLGGDKEAARAAFIFPGRSGTANMRSLADGPDARRAGVKIYDC